MIVITSFVLFVGFILLCFTIFADDIQFRVASGLLLVLCFAVFNLVTYYVAQEQMACSMAGLEYRWGECH